MIGRRSFIAATVAGSAAFAWKPGGSLAQDPETPPAQLEPESVREFVGKSHFDFDRVKELTKQEPMLVNASWDWGDGDWETGLGAAAHTGRRNIAEFLLENGSRIDAFAAAMLGITPVVKTLLDSQDNLNDVRGPHKIPLLSHAIVGGQKSDDVFLLAD